MCVSGNGGGCQVGSVGRIFFIFYLFFIFSKACSFYYRQNSHKYTVDISKLRLNRLLLCGGRKNIRYKHSHPNVKMLEEPIHDI